jgi:hypothetical protein
MLTKAKRARASWMSVVVQAGRQVQIAELLAILIADGVANLAVVHPLRPVLRIPDDLIDEVAQVHDEVEALVGRRALVLPDHAAPGVLGAVIDALAGDEGEADLARVVRRRRRGGAADPAAEAIGAGEAIPVLAARLQAADHHAHRPVAVRRALGRRGRDDALEGLVLRHLDGQPRRLGPKAFVASGGRAARPQDHAVALRVGRGNAFGEEVALLGVLQL